MDLMFTGAICQTLGGEHSTIEPTMYRNQGRDVFCSTNALTVVLEDEGVHLRSMLLAV